MTRSPLEEFARQNFPLIGKGIQARSGQDDDTLMFYRPCKAMLVKLSLEDTPEERIVDAFMDFRSGIERKVRQIGDTPVINLFQALLLLGILWLNMKSPRRTVRSIR